MTKPNRSLPVRVDLRLSPEERDRLTVEAKERGIARQELIRSRVLATDDAPAVLPRKKPLFRHSGRETIDRAIHAVQRVYPGMPTQRLEPIVCSVICAIAAEDAQR